MHRVDVEAARRVLNEQPFNGVVGARLVSLGAGEAVLEIDIADHHRQQFGVVHGGVLAYAADNALTFAAGSVLGPSVLTGGVAVNYLRPAREGVLRATAVVARSTTRRAVCTVEVLNVAAPGAEPSLCAIAQGWVTRTGGDGVGCGRSSAVGETVDQLYEAFAAADAVALAGLLHPQFVGRVSDGMPFDAGGAIDGPEQMLRDVWGATFTEFDTAPRPDEVVVVGADRAIVFGYYRGRSRATGRRYEAAFTHDIVVRDEKIASLVQVTDTKPWHDALIHYDTDRVVSE